MLPSCLPTHSMLSVCAQVQKVVDIVKAKGGKVSREPGPVKGGKSIIAFVEDPDGYKFELIQRGPTPEPFCQVMLRVGDLERAVTFYEKVCWNIWQGPCHCHAQIQIWALFWILLSTKLLCT